MLLLPDGNQIPWILQGAIIVQTGNVRVSIYNTPNEFLLNIDCFDMAIESGWYTVTLLASVMGAGSGKLYITDEMSFDPPTGGGPGLPPSVDAYI